MDDIELLGRYAQEQDQQAFSTLVERHEAWVYAAARRQVRDEHAAQDVAQAVFVMLARRAGKLKGYGYLGGWLFRALSYCSEHVQRERVRRKKREAEAARMRGEVTSMEADWEEIAPKLEAAVGKLGKADRDAVLLRFYERRPLAEVGRCLGISEKAAQKRVERAVGKLREKLAGKGVAVEAGSLGAMVLAHAAGGGGGMEGGAAGLVEKVMAGIGGGGAGNGTARMIAKGAMKMMVWAKVKVVVVVGAVFAAGGITALMAQNGTPAASTATMPATAAVAEDIPAPMKRIIAQLQQTRSRITSVVCTVTQQGRARYGSLGFRESSSKMQVFEKGDKRATLKHVSIKAPDGSSPVQEYTTRAVLSGTYHAHRWDDAGIAEQYLFESPAGMPDKAAAQLASYNGISILLDGFGNGIDMFDSPKIRDTASARWEVTESQKPEGGTEYQCKKTVLRDGRYTPISLWVLDPDRGACVTRLIDYYPDGQIAGEKTVTPVEVAPGIFLPSRVESKGYVSRFTPLDGLGIKSVDDPISTATLTFSDVRVNEGIPDERFTMSFLELPKGATVNQHQIDGSTKSLVTVGNRVIDLRAAAAALSAQKRADDTAGGDEQKP